MTVLLDWLAAFFVLVGLFFFIVAAVGIVRLPDTYHRLHAASKSSTLGLMGLLIGVVLHLGSTEVGAKAAAVLAFAFVAAPIGSHLLAKAALRADRDARGGREACGLWDQTLSDEHAEDSVK